jgi:hypothetical protein
MQVLDTGERREFPHVILVGAARLLVVDGWRTRSA